MNPLDYLKREKELSATYSSLSKEELVHYLTFRDLVDEIMDPPSPWNFNITRPITKDSSEPPTTPIFS